MGMIRDLVKQVNASEQNAAEIKEFAMFLIFQCNTPGEAPTYYYRALNNPAAPQAEQTQFQQDIHAGNFP